MNCIWVAIFWQHGPLWKLWGGQLSVALIFQFRRSYFGNTLFTPSLDLENAAEVYFLQMPVGVFLHDLDLKEIKETWAASGSTPWGRPLPLARAAKLLDATLPEKVGETQELLAEDYQWDLQPPLRSQPPGQELCTCEVFVPHIWQGAWGWTISEYYLKYNAHHLWCHGKSFTGFFFVAMIRLWSLQNLTLDTEDRRE